jgi:hypothetical protein
MADNMSNSSAAPKTLLYYLPVSWIERKTAAKMMQLQRQTYLKFVRIAATSRQGRRILGEKKRKEKKRKEKKERDNNTLKASVMCPDTTSRCDVRRVETLRHLNSAFRSHPQQKQNRLSVWFH